MKKKINLFNKRDYVIVAFFAVSLTISIARLIAVNTSPFGHQVFEHRSMLVVDVRTDFVFVPQGELLAQTVEGVQGCNLLLEHESAAITKQETTVFFVWEDQSFTVILQNYDPTCAEFAVGQWWDVRLGLYGLEPQHTIPKG